jgi:tripartite-type tricarboxylate transporter receptor subunit TctC
MSTPLRHAAALIVALLLGAVPARAEDKPIQVVIAFPPGGTSTACMKPLIEPMAAALGRPIELDYRPGAGGNVAAVHVARAAPDGSTLLFGHAGPLAINHHINQRSFFDPAKDFRPLALVVRYPIVVGAAATTRIRSLADLNKAARDGPVVVGSSGNGSVQHLAGEIYRFKADIPVLLVPFAGGGPLQQALMRGDLHVLFESGSNTVEHIKAGRLRALGVMWPERLATLPDTPTLAEQGFQDLDVSAWFGLLAPAATPDDAAARLSDAVLAALDRPEVRKALQDIGGLPSPMPPAAFAELIAAENARWGRVVRDAGIKPD